MSKTMVKVLRHYDEISLSGMTAQVAHLEFFEAVETMKEDFDGFLFL